MDGLCCDVLFYYEFKERKFGEWRIMFNKKDKDNYRRIRQKDIFIDNEKIKRSNLRIEKIKEEGTIRLLIEFLINEEIILLRKKRK